MTPVNENEARIDEFRSEIDGLKLKGSSGEGEKRLLVIGIVLVAVGIGLAVLGAVQVGSSGGSPADQRAFMAQGSFMGLALIIAGAALFVRYSLARYLRFWLIRMTYESRANTDRVVDAIERASGLPPANRRPGATWPALLRRPTSPTSRRSRRWCAEPVGTPSEDLPGSDPTRRLRTVSQAPGGGRRRPRLRR